MRDDLRRWGIALVDGLHLVLYTEDADAEGAPLAAGR
jgi:hypothetical protein